MSSATTTYDKRYESDVLEYFGRKADEYDRVDEQVYWNLSDRLLWHVMQQHVLRPLGEQFAFLDAGGGTGRWTARILETYPKSRGVLYDLTAAMSDKAREKAQAGGFADRLGVHNGRLEDVAAELKGQSFDLVFNFHNVLGFVQDVESVIAQLASLLRRGGSLVSFVPSKYHCAFFNVTNSRLDESEHALREDRGRFTTDMPHMHAFTPRGLRALYEQHGLAMELLTGFPSLIYPGFQETQLRGSTQSLTNILGDSANFERIYAMEESLVLEPEIAARGNNLFALGTRV